MRYIVEGVNAQGTFTARGPFDTYDEALDAAQEAQRSHEENMRRGAREVAGMGIDMSQYRTSFRVRQRP